MPAIRIQLPGRKEPSIIALQGPKITIGRSPANTLQVVDRTLSSCHAELVHEGDHYLLHDAGSTNGTYVNGNRISDFHLREKCRIAFGTLECEFLPDISVNSASPVETVPTREEIDLARAEIARLTAELEKTRQAEEELRRRSAAFAEADARSIPKDQHQLVVIERDKLEKEADELRQALAELRKELTMVQENRTALQQRAETTTAEVETLQSENHQLQERLDQVKADTFTLEKSVAALRAERETWTRLRGEHETLVRDHEALEHAQEELKARAEEFERLLAETQSEKTVLGTLLQTESQKVADLQKTLAHLEQQAAQQISEEKFQKVEMDRAAADAARKHLEKNFATITAELNSLSVEREELWRICREQKVAIEDLRSQREDLMVLRSENSGLLEKATQLAEQVRILEASRADVSSEPMTVPKQDYEALLAEHAAAIQRERQHEEEVKRLREEIAAIRSRYEISRVAQKERHDAGKEAEAVQLPAPRNSPPLEPSQPRTLDIDTADLKASPKLEEALRELGFVIRPIRTDQAPSAPNEESA